MSRKKYTPEQVISHLRTIEMLIGRGKTTQQACREAQITEQTYYRWRKEYGGMQTSQAKKLKLLEQENTRLKKAVAELTLDKLILKEAVEGKY